MNKRQRIIKIGEVWKRYHIPSMPNYYKRPKNAIFISSANSYKHEQLKFKTCYELREAGIDFITECVENKKDLNLGLFLL